MGEGVSCACGRHIWRSSSWGSSCGSGVTSGGALACLLDETIDENLSHRACEDLLFDGLLFQLQIRYIAAADGHGEEEEEVHSQSGLLASNCPHAVATQDEEKTSISLKLLGYPSTGKCGISLRRGWRMRSSVHAGRRYRMWHRIPDVAARICFLCSGGRAVTCRDVAAFPRFSRL